MSKIYVRFLSTYLAVIAAVLICLLPIMDMSIRSAQETERKELLSFLQNGSDRLEEQILSYNYIASQLAENRLFVSHTLKSEPFLPSDIYQASNIQKNFAHMIRSYPLHSFAYITFSQNDTVLDSERIHISQESFYEKFFSINSLTLADWQLYLRQTHGGLAPQQCMRLFGRPDNVYITYQIQKIISGEASFTLSILISRSALMDLLVRYDMADSAELAIFNQDGLPVAAYPDTPGLTEAQFISAAKTDQLLTQEISLLGLNVYLLMRSGPSQKLLEKTRATLILCLCGVLISGLVLAFFFSYLDGRPIKRLVSRLTDPYEDKKRLREDAYTYIENAVRSLHIRLSDFSQKLNDMNDQLRHNRFHMMLYGFPLDNFTPIEKAPESQDHFKACIVLIDLSSDANVSPEPLTMVAVTSLFKQVMPAGSFVHIAGDMLIAAFVPFVTRPDEIDERLVRLVKRMTSFGSHVPAIVVSTPCHQPSEVADAFWRAKQYIECNKVSGVLHYPNDGLSRQNALDFTQIQALYQALIAGNAACVTTLLETYANALVLAAPTEHQKIYYAVRTALDAACEKLGAAIGLPLDYNRTLNNAVLIGDWRRAADTLLEKANARRLSGNILLKQQLEAYVAEHYMDSQICVASIAEHFSISAKHVSTLIREQTGHSYTEFLENIRLNKATNLLAHSNQSMQQIADSVGFASLNTFYKAFKRQYAVSPSGWRERNCISQNSSLPK